jgi:uncharacterized protein YjbI with pentapeptide repeats
MPDEHGIPTDEEIKKWHARWRPEWVEDVVHILQEDPEWGAKKIVELSWYTEENGFERWLEKEKQDYVRRWLRGRTILDLRGCPFQENVNLQGICLNFSHFEGAFLRDANISDASLHEADFSGADLWKAIFSGTQLINARLMGAILVHTNFSGAALMGARFLKAHLWMADLSGANLLRTDFSEAYLGYASFIKANICGAGFLDCYLHGIVLRSADGYAKCDDETVFGRSQGESRRWTIQLFDWRLLRKQELLPQEAVRICSEIRLCFRDNGLFHKAAMYYQQEEYWRTRATWEEIGTWKGCLKKGNRWKSFLLLCRYILGERFMGYGEHPGYIIGWSLGLIVLCAIIFFLFGFQYETLPRVFEPMSSSSFVFFSAEAWIYLLKCLRFSIENFVTLGFSKMQPAEGISHWVASLEGVVGVLFVALATVTWARKAIRD